MRITYSRLLNISFALHVIASILLNGTTHGKLIQFFFVLCSIASFGINSKKGLNQAIRPYHILEWFFVGYVLFQVLLDIAVSSSTTSSMAVTLAYTALFMLAVYNYIIYVNDLFLITKIYASTTILSMFMVAILYFDTIVSFRLSASEAIYIMGIKMFQGGSSTALAMQIVIPAFFIMLFPPNRNRKASYPYVGLLLLFSLLTGTRKVLIIFIYIFVVNELMKRNRFGKKIVKMMFLLGVGCFGGYYAITNIPILYEVIGSRIENMFLFLQTSKTTDSSIRVRNRMIESAIELFRLKPMSGWGMNYYETTSKYSYSHNNFLELLAGGGIIGTIIYYSKYIYLFFATVRCSIFGKKNRMLWISIVGFLLIMYIIEYWQVTYFYRYIMIYQAFILAIIKLENNDKLRVSGD